jgi:hypothetical protein
MSIVFGMATKKSDDLGVDVKRGNRAALKAGRWIGKPKLGYVRDAKSKNLVPDPERFELVREMWRLRILGYPTMQILRVARDEWGLKMPQHGRTGGRLITPSTIYRMFADPFYAGTMVVNGELFQGNHKPMISIEEFERVRGLTVNAAPPIRPKTPLGFLYKGLFKCGACGSAITAENTVNRHGKKYTYYRCSKKRRHYRFCEEKSVRAEVVDDAVGLALSRITWPEQATRKLYEQLEDFEKTQVERLEELNESTRKIIADCDLKLERLRDYLVRGIIGEEEYLRDKKATLEMKIEAESRLTRPDNQQILQPLKTLNSLLSRAKKKYEAMEFSTKQRFLKLMFSNPVIKEKTPLIEAKFPLRIVPENNQFSGMLAFGKEVRTLVDELESILGLSDSKQGY